MLPLFIQMTNTETSVDLVNEKAEYCNARYKFCVEYPIAILTDKLISDNGDGAVLFTENDDLLVTVSGSWNVSKKDSWELYDDFIAERLELNPESQVRYSIVEEDYYEVVYLLDGRYFYQKLFNKGGKQIILQIEVSKDNYTSLKEMRNSINIDFS